MDSGTSKQSAVDDGATATDPLARLDEARAEFIRALQLAYSGEWGAVRAYLGHRAGLRRKPKDRNCITQILKDELRHRQEIKKILHELGSAPDLACERKLNRVGCLISSFCRVGGWFWPMYGAARLERDNIVEYEIVARLAWHAQLPQYIDTLLHLGEVEWDHEYELRTRAASHWMWKFVPGWDAPAPRASLRERFAAFEAGPTPVERRTSWLVR